MATAHSSHHFTLTEAGIKGLQQLQGFSALTPPLNPLRRASSSPSNFTPKNEVPADGWGPLLLRDIRVIDFQLTEELRVVYKEIFRLLIQGPDFYQEQTVKEIGRNQLHTATELSFKIGCLATANGSCISATLSSICGIPDRGKRDRTATAYVLEVDKCTEHLLLNRCFQQIAQRSEVLSIDAPGQLVTPKETPIGLWDFGLAAVPGYLQTGKYPANQLLRKNIHGLPPPQEDEDEDEGEGAV